MSEKITVFTVDDHPLLRDGLATVINAQPDMRLVGQASTGRDAIQGFRQHKADVIVMDLRLPDMSGIDAMKAIQAEFPSARCIIFHFWVRKRHSTSPGRRGASLHPQNDVSNRVGRCDSPGSCWKEENWGPNRSRTSRTLQ